jgi:ferrous iron transport protein B
VLVPKIKTTFPELPNPKWVALRLLDGDQRIGEAVRLGELGNLSQQSALVPAPVHRIALEAA